MWALLAIYPSFVPLWLFYFFQNLDRIELDCPILPSSQSVFLAGRPMPPFPSFSTFFIIHWETLWSNLPFLLWHLQELPTKRWLWLGKKWEKRITIWCWGWEGGYCSQPNGRDGHGSNKREFARYMSLCPLPRGAGTNPARDMHWCL